MMHKTQRIVSLRSFWITVVALFSMLSYALGTICSEVPTYVITGGSSQFRYDYFDTLKGEGVSQSFSVESYQIEPAPVDGCTYAGISSNIVDKQSGGNVDAYFSGDESGLINYSWDGVSYGMRSYVWSVNMPDGTAHIQKFKVYFVDLDSFDCDLAFFQTPVTFLAREKFGDFSIIEITDVPMNIELYTGGSTQCGDKSLQLLEFLPEDYVGGPVVLEWLTVDIDANEFKFQYNENSDQALLGANSVSLPYGYSDFPQSVNTVTVELTVDCPDIHTGIIVGFNNTRVEVPRFLYDLDNILPLTLPMNTWKVAPSENPFYCFGITEHKIVDKATNTAVDYITVTDFNQGKLLVDLIDYPSFTTQDLDFEWYVKVDDGTDFEKIMTFEIFFTYVDECQKTTLQHAWPLEQYSQKMFEANPPHHLLNQVSDFFANKTGEFDECGSRLFKFYDYPDIANEISWIQFDLAAQEWWIDVQDDKFRPNQEHSTSLVVKLNDFQEEVTQVFILIKIEITCSDFHQSIDVLNQQTTTLEYDLSDNWSQKYQMSTIKLWPYPCFTVTDVIFRDSNGDHYSYASLWGASYSLHSSAKNQFEINFNGVRDWSLFDKEILMSYDLQISDSTTVASYQTYSVKFVSSKCYDTTFPNGLSVEESVYPGETPTSFATTLDFDIETSTHDSIGPNQDYCGPQVVNVYQFQFNDQGLKIWEGPMTQGTLSTPDHGETLLEFNTAQHKDYGTYLFQVEVGLKYFPGITRTHNITVNYLCPIQALIEILLPMPETSFIYQIQAEPLNLKAQLSLIRLSACYNVVRHFFVYQESGQDIEADFISIDDENNLILQSNDTDGTLQDSIVDFTYMIDVSDVQKNIPISTFTIEFQKQNVPDLPESDFTDFTGPTPAEESEESIEQETVAEEEEVVQEQEVEEQSITEELTEEEQQIQLFIFDWRAAFFNKQEELNTQQGSSLIEIDSPPKPRFKYFKQTGELQIAFDQDMQIIQNLQVIKKGKVKVNGEILPIFDIIARPSEDNEDEEHAKKLELDWEITEMTERTINFKIIFKTAIHVSQLAASELDIVKVIFRDRHLFLSQQSNQAISQEETQNLLRNLDQTQDISMQELIISVEEDDFIMIERSIPPQIQMGGVEQQIQEALSTAGSGGNVVIASNFLINLLIAGSLNHVLQMIRTQQLVIMMPLFQVSMPANAGMFFNTIMTIAAFDFYEFDEYIHRYFNIEPTDPIGLNFEVIGFESQYFLNNMGTMAIFCLVYILCLCLTPCLDRCQQAKGCCMRFKNCSKRLGQQARWRTLITLMNESYSIVIVCVLINIQIYSRDTTGLSVMSNLCASILSLCILLPVIFIGKVYFNFKKIGQTEFRAKFGEIYEGLKLYAGKKILLYPSLYFLRRLLLAISICLIGKVLALQLVLMVAQIMIQVVILGLQVFDRPRSRSEYFNECILAMVMYSIFCFSPWIEDPQTKFYIGYVPIAIVCLHLLFSIVPISIGTFKLSKHKCKRKMLNKSLKKQRKINKQKFKKVKSVRIAEQAKQRKEQEEIGELILVYQEYDLGYSSDDSSSDLDDDQITPFSQSTPSNGKVTFGDKIIKNDDGSIENYLYTNQLIDLGQVQLHYDKESMIDPQPLSILQISEEISDDISEENKGNESVIQVEATPRFSAIKAKEDQLEPLTMAVVGDDSTSLTQPNDNKKARALKDITSIFEEFNKNFIVEYKEEEKPTAQDKAFKDIEEEIKEIELEAEINVYDRVINEYESVVKEQRIADNQIAIDPNSTMQLDVPSVQEQEFPRQSRRSTILPSQHSRSALVSTQLQFD